MRAHTQRERHTDTVVTDTHEHAQAQAQAHEHTQAYTCVHERIRVLSDDAKRPACLCMYLLTTGMHGSIHARDRDARVRLYRTS